MSESRFFVPGPLVPGNAVRLDSERSNYLSRVLRHKAGDRIICFDGGGDAHVCTLSHASGRLVELLVGDKAASSTPPRFQLHVGLGLIKGASMDRALQQCTELGASDIWLVAAARSNVKLDQRRSDNKLTHWIRVLQASCEQCGALRLPTLHPTLRLDDLLENAPANPIALHTEGVHFPKTLEPHDRLVLIGPEGGWDDAELRLFDSREVPCYSLGSLTFRAETAPSVALALIQQAQGWL